MRHSITLCLLSGLLTIGVFYALKRPRTESVASQESPDVLDSGPSLLTRSVSNRVSTTAPKAEEKSRERPQEDLGTLLAGIADDGDKAAVKILDLALTLEGEERQEAVLQGTLLLTEKDYRSALPFLYDESPESPAREIVMNDLEGRSEFLRLPVFLELAQKPSHPLQAEAAEALRTALQQDLGEDWSRWQRQIEDHLEQRNG